MTIRTSIFLAALVLPVAAVANDIPGNRNTKAVLDPPRGVSGVFNRQDDSDWFRVSLKAGTNYAFDVDPFDEAACALLNIRDLATGKVLLTAFGTGGNDGGFEFQPKKDRSLFVEVKDCSSGGSDLPSYPATYSVRVAGDARNDATTKATLAVGQTRKGTFNFNGDRDWYRVQLNSNKSYTVALTNGDDEVLWLVDPNGKVLYAESGGTEVSLRGVTVLTSGTYYVIAAIGIGFRLPVQAGSDQPLGASTMIPSSPKPTRAMIFGDGERLGRTNLGHQ